MSARSINLNQLAQCLRENGLDGAYVGTTGGNCHSVIVPLDFGAEILVGDPEGPMPDGEENIDGIIALAYWPDLIPWTTEHGRDGVLYESPTDSTDLWQAARDAAEAVTAALDEAGIMTQAAATGRTGEERPDTRQAVTIQLIAGTDDCLVRIGHLYLQPCSIDPAGHQGMAPFRMRREVAEHIVANRGSVIPQAVTTETITF